VRNPHIITVSGNGWATGRDFRTYEFSTACERPSLIGRINWLPHHRFDHCGDVVFCEVTCKPFAYSLLRHRNCHLKRNGSRFCKRRQQIGMWITLGRRQVRDRPRCRKKHSFRYMARLDCDRAETDAWKNVSVVNLVDSERVASNCSGQSRYVGLLRTCLAIPGKY
jgi:hypothetical protein